MWVFPCVLVCGRREGISMKGKGTGTGIQRFGPWSHLSHQLSVTSGSLVPGGEHNGTLEGAVVGCVGWLRAVHSV